MMQVDVNYFAVVVAAIANMAVGFAWYGPLFGAKWVKLMGWTPEQMEVGKAKMKSEGWKTYLFAFVGSLAMAYVISSFLAFGGSYLGISGVSLALVITFWSWVGFIAPVALSSVLWEGKSWALWILTNGYYVVSLLIMSIILALWV